MKTVTTFTATIYLSLRAGYTDTVYSMEEVDKLCKDYCEEVGLCVSVSPVRYIHVSGTEDGCSITLINYPRFPATVEEILKKAFGLAKILKKAMRQHRVSIVCSDYTYMLEEGDEDDLHWDSNIKL